jgi:hypothetical protein
VYAFQPAPSRITTRSTSPHTSLVPFERKLHKGSSSRDRDTTSTLKMGLFGGKPDPTVQIPIQDYKDQWKVLPDMWETLAKIIPDNTMLTDNISPHTGTQYMKIHFKFMTMTMTMTVIIKTITMTITTITKGNALGRNDHCGDHLCHIVGIVAGRRSEPMGGDINCIRIF